jgi:type IV pilus assembly protein PilY1
MKKYLSFIFLILAFFSADVMAVKRLPPGAEGATTGKANLLIMVPAAGKDTSWLDDTSQHPTDVVVDSRGYVFVKQHPNFYDVLQRKNGFMADRSEWPLPRDQRYNSRVLSRFKPDSEGSYTWDQGLLQLRGIYSTGEKPLGCYQAGNPSGGGSCQKREPYPSKSAIDGNDNIYFTSRGHGDKGGIYSVTTAGAVRDPITTNYPIGLDIDSSGNIWVTASKDEKFDGPDSDLGPYYVRKLDSSGTQLAEWEIQTTEFAGPGRSRVPFGISVYDGKVYVLSQTRGRSGGFGIFGKHPGSHPECRRGYSVQVYDATTGDLLTTWYALGAHDIEVNANGVYVVGRNSQSSDPHNNACGGQVGKYSHSGVFIKRFARQQTDCDKASIVAPIGLTSDPGGNIYVAGGGLKAGTQGKIGWSFRNLNQWQNVKKYSADGDYLATVSAGDDRRSIVKCAVKELLSDPTVTSKVNLGLVAYHKGGGYGGNSVAAKVLVGVSPTGAGQIPPLLCAHCPDAYENNFKNTLKYPEPDQEQALQIVKGYYQSGAGGFPSPLNPSSCESHAVLLLTEQLRGCGVCGSSHPKNPAKDLFDMGVRVYIAGFKGQRPKDRWAEGKENYYQTAEAGGTTPFSPIFIGGPPGSKGAAESIKDMIKAIALGSNGNITKRFTGTTPSISSDAAGDYIYQSTFLIPPSGQWVGRLVKSSLDASSGKVGDKIWDAAEQLKLKLGGRYCGRDPHVGTCRGWKDRKIYTVPHDWGSGVRRLLVKYASSYQAYKLTTFRAIKDLINWRARTPLTTLEAVKLTQFIWGIDSFDEKQLDPLSSIYNYYLRDSPLGDIYHSEMAIVGPPKAIDTEKASNPKTEAHYKSANGYQNFIDRWASRGKVVYVGANDGMLHAFKDSTGELLWSFVPPQMWSKLRSMVSGLDHVTIPIYGVDGSPVVKDIYVNGQWRTVLIAGMGRGGQGYFALDVTDGNRQPEFLFAFENDSANQVIRHWVRGETWNSVAYTEKSYSEVSDEYDYSKLGLAVSTPTIMLVSSGTGGAQKWVAAIGGGLNNTSDKDYGSVAYLIDLENGGRIDRAIPLADASGGFKNSHPAQITAVTPDTTSAANYKGAMLYSADMESKVFKIDRADSYSALDSTQYFDAEGNDANQRANFSPVTVSIDADNTLWMYFGTGNQERMQLSQASIKNRIFGIKDTLFPEFDDTHSTQYSRLKNVTDTDATCPGDTDKGWYIDLNRDEKVTNKVAIEKGVLSVPIYTPDSTQLCFAGTSALHELGYGCGKSLKKTDLGQGYVSGVRIFKDKTYMGISGTNDSDIETTIGDSFIKKANIISGGTVAAESSSSQEAVLESWRERF